MNRMFEYASSAIKITLALVLMVVAAAIKSAFVFAEIAIVWFVICAATGIEFSFVPAAVVSIAVFVLIVVATVASAIYDAM